MATFGAVVLSREGFHVSVPKRELVFSNSYDTILEAQALANHLAGCELRQRMNLFAICGCAFISVSIVLLAHPWEYVGMIYWIIL